MSTTTSAGEQAGLSDEHLSPLTGNSGLFPLKEEEKENLHEDGSVFNITFYGHIEEDSTKENGSSTVTINTNVQEINYHSNNQKEKKF